MKSQIQVALPLFLGALWGVGCGGPMDEGLAEEVPAANPIPAQYLEPEGSIDGDGTVGALRACCFFRCGDNVLRGPFPSIEYGNCTNYGKYRCARKGMSFKNSSWRDC
ncbi:hypothetical protein [Comamonas sp. JC664]|uniref:hypothetical protein n=1 Tax=Comamonas sp. JC664 TaxID=2801917 RepID=UPI00174BFD40|nr:hypothetical protein [Comamonas sp. JC664]MBL0697972.1 hypothetical protein [Comamonas sp. JC664]GHG70611.1 hypothetical protein GCM10012319_15710 [Comamonas sp. KCTC 72670]